MFRFEIINSSKIKIKKNIIKNIFKEFSELIKKSQNGNLNIIFVIEKEIQKLNKNYRKINKSTDVLSFWYFDDFSNLKNKDIAWELIFCEEKIISQAIEYWLWEEKEFYKLLIHSILHILWYDHEENNDYKKMQNFENMIWNKIFEKKD